MLDENPAWSYLRAPISKEFMSNKSRPVIVARVDSRIVKYIKPKDLGIDFTNEIDIWAKMEFKSRKQIERLKQNNSLDGHDVLQDLNTIVYAVREKIES